MSEQSLTVEWIDSGREPKCAPNPLYPNGKPADITFGAERFCKMDLPYPAKRCGLYVVTCKVCGWRVGVTTAGRPDDPPWVALPCKLDGAA